MINSVFMNERTELYYTGHSYTPVTYFTATHTCLVTVERLAGSTGNWVTPTATVAQAGQSFSIYRKYNSLWSGNNSIYGIINIKITIFETE